MLKNHPWEVAMSDSPHPGRRFETTELLWPLSSFYLTVTGHYGAVNALRFFSELCDVKAL